ncbi:LLM class flavin-dependent oxidoreductase [Micromonospora sp. WMMD980]|uniref:LLM class flavin-dependent oxidoreductase n=1 Tax=Micromonospora sp. WMMD980 TaxID=3016088 RepID=UPI002417C0B4|nr:LLM class flavin-dependent oxidoreductase [Micromonospora sp. WMMD980]MDG4803220.1 LLM class flavin-dependent oxidoreductase [Micromonospora sp. WMMD980]
MKRGLMVSTVGEYADPKVLVSLAVAAESHGWQGFFLNDYLLYKRDVPTPVTDTWVALAAIAAKTRRIVIGPMVTALARRDPWTVAKQLVALQQLAPGRIRFGTGAGGPAEADFGAFGRETSYQQRRDRMLEALGLLRQFLNGTPARHVGTYYQVAAVKLLPLPITPIPIWAGGYWPGRSILELAATADGVFPEKRDGDLTPDDVAQMRAVVDGIARPDGLRTELIVEGRTDGEESRFDGYAGAGADWFLEYVGWRRGGPAAAYERIRQGPAGGGAAPTRSSNL